MVGQPFRLLVRPAGMLGLDRRQDPAMCLDPAGTSQRIMRDFAQQRVTKAILDIGIEADLDEDLRRYRLPQCSCCLRRRVTGHPFHKPQRHARPDHGKGLQQCHTLGRPTIDTRRDHVVDGRRHANRLGRFPAGTATALRLGSLSPGHDGRQCALL